jgi:hypothetical protein
MILSVTVFRPHGCVCMSAQPEDDTVLSCLCVSSVSIHDETSAGLQRPMSGELWFKYVASGTALQLNTSAEHWHCNDTSSEYKCRASGETVTTAHHFECFLNVYTVYSGVNRPQATTNWEHKRPASREQRQCRST